MILQRLTKLLLSASLLCFMLLPSLVSAQCNDTANFSYRIDQRKVTIKNLSTGTGFYYYQLEMGGPGNTSSYKYFSNNFDSIEFTYNNRGTFKVVLKMWDSTQNGCFDSTFQNITINLCSVQAKLYKYYTTNSSAAFIQQSINDYNGNLAHKWYFGDGDSSSLKNSYHTYSSSGPFNVRYIVSDTNYGNCKDTLDFQVVLGDCRDTIALSYMKVAGRTYDFFPDSTRYDEHFWSFSLSGPNKTKKVPNISIWQERYTFPANNNYFVGIRGIRTGYKYCVDSSWVYLTVLDSTCNSKADFSYTLNNKTVTVTNKGTYGNKVVLNFGNGVTYNLNANFTTQSYTYPAHGNYTITLTAEETVVPNCVKTKTANISIIGCSLYTNFQYEIVSGTTVKFIAQAYNYLKLPLIYEWNFNNIGSSTSAMPTYTFTGSGPYSVKLKIRDTTFGYNYCKDSLTINLNMNACDTPVVYTTINDKLVTFMPDTLTVKYVYQFTWKFYGNDSTHWRNTYYNFPDYGNYNVKLKTWSLNNRKYCFVESRIPISLPKPACYLKAGFRITQDTTNNYSGLIYDTSFITRPSNVSYLWHFGDGDSSTSQSPSHTYPGIGNYLLCLTISDSTCKSSFCKYIGFDSIGNMNAFAPFSIKVVDQNVSIETKEAKKSQYFIYPNPSSDFVNIYTNNQDAYTVQVYSLSGKVLIVHNSDNGNTSVNLKDLASGIYFIRIINSLGNQETYRLIKQ